MTYLNTYTILYAHDTNVFILDKNIDRLFKKANHTLARSGTWLNYNKLMPNISKTNYILSALRNTVLSGALNSSITM